MSRTRDLTGLVRPFVGLTPSSPLLSLTSSFFPLLLFQVWREPTSLRSRHVAFPPPSFSRSSLLRLLFLLIRSRLSSFLLPPAFQRRENEAPSPTKQLSRFLSFDPSRKEVSCNAIKSTRSLDEQFRPFDLYTTGVEAPPAEATSSLMLSARKIKEEESQLCSSKTLESSRAERKRREDEERRGLGLTRQLRLLSSDLSGVGSSLSGLNLESLNFSGEFEDLVLKTEGKGKGGFQRRKAKREIRVDSFLN